MYPIEKTIELLDKWIKEEELEKKEKAKKKKEKISGKTDTLKDKK